MWVYFLRSSCNVGSQPPVHPKGFWDPDAVHHRRESSARNSALYFMSECCGSLHEGKGKKRRDRGHDGSRREGGTTESADGRWGEWSAVFCRQCASCILSISRYVVMYIPYLSNSVQSMHHIQPWWVMIITDLYEQCANILQSFYGRMLLYKNHDYYTLYSFNPVHCLAITSKALLCWRVYPRYQVKCWLACINTASVTDFTAQT